MAFRAPFSLLILTMGMLLRQVSQAQEGMGSYSRIQTRNLRWQVFRTREANVYYPTGCDSLCAAASRNLPHAIAHVKRWMGSVNRSAQSIIIYPSLTQLYESNVGSRTVDLYTFPTFVANGERHLLAFTGSYRELAGQLREAIALSAWESQVGSTGNSITNVIAREKIPEWFKAGAVKWFANGWTLQLEEDLRLLYAKDSPVWFGGLLTQSGTLVGTALCQYLEIKYGEGAMRNIYFQLRKNRTLANAVRLVAKKPLEEVYSDCFGFFSKRFFYQWPQSPAVSSKERHDRKYNVVLSPDTAFLVFIKESRGRRQVILRNNQTGRQKPIFTMMLPPWISNHHANIYPLIEWTKDGNLLITAPRKGGLTTSVRAMPDGRRLARVNFPNIDGLTSVGKFDESEYLVSGWTYGHPDIIRYSVRRNQYFPITNNYAKEFDVDLTDTKDIVYAFDAEQDSIPYVEPSRFRTGIGIIKSDGSSELVSDTFEYSSWSAPFLAKNGALMAITFHYGQRDTVTFVQGDWLPNRAVAGLTAGRESAWLLDYRRNTVKKREEDSILRGARDTTEYLLSNILGKGGEKEVAKRRSDSTRAAARFSPSKASPYVLQLYSAYFSARISNNYFINHYQPFLAYQGLFKVPEPGGLAAVGVSDVFDNHHFSIGYRLPVRTEGSDFFVKYENEVTRLDWGLSYFRKIESLNLDAARAWVDKDGKLYPNAAKVKTHWYEIYFGYPLTYRTRLSLRSSIRKDRTIFTATERYSLDFQPINSLWLFNAISFRHDALHPTLPNLWRGVVVNAGIDLFKGFTQGEDGLGGVSGKVSWHVPTYRFITIVMQAQSGVSGGDAAILYSLGGVNNNLTVRTDSTVHFQQNLPYAFQTLATPLRGYYQNALYGSCFTLFNTDIYFPLFPGLIPLETNFAAINNVQLGVFTDWANAWELYHGSLTKKSEWRWSVGCSGRTILAGYPIRVDVAWPRGFIHKPVWYLSLSL